MKKINSSVLRRNTFLFVSILFLLIISQRVVIAQMQEINFVDTFSINNNSAATFGVVGNIDQINEESIITKVSNLTGIVSFRFFYKRRCLIVYNNTLNISELRTALTSENIDFDLNTISTLKIEIADDLKNKKGSYPEYKPSILPIDPINWVYPPSFPTFKNTGNPEFDTLEFEKAKALWSRIYPEESKLMTGDEYMNDYNYTYLKKQFNKNSY